ncbi:hypothetical protein NDU88_004838 [Pleurodeles waltl]|uniref:Uncharacterized protein n=1 Tax=Pleurodeles waltl TaxID=8319 RepID=A0AAV7VI87_PLEWA|nr:hypothetical protein NDU88_004838 [Pleurodeles waltl]
MSHLAPAQDLAFVGVRLRTDSNLMTVPDKRVPKTQNHILNFMGSDLLTGTDWLKVQGDLVMTIVPWTRWYLNASQTHSKPLVTHKAKSEACHTYDQPHEELLWWMSTSNILKDIPLKSEDPVITTTDASASG